MNSEQFQIEDAIKQLGLQTTNDQNDWQELKKLLMLYLRYPNVRLAEIHHKANTLGESDRLAERKQESEEKKNQTARQNTQQITFNEKQDIKQENKEIMKESRYKGKVCNCCATVRQKERLPYCISLNDLNLGVGVYLFFKNYVFHSIVFLLMFLVYSVYALVTNIKVFNDANGLSSLCLWPYTCGLSQIGGGSKILNQYAESNRLSVVQAWLGVAVAGLWGLLYLAKTYHEEKFIAATENRRHSASDFTLKLSRVPRSYFVDTSNNPLDENRVQKVQNNILKKQINQILGQKKPQKQTQYKYLSYESLKQKFNNEMLKYAENIKSETLFEVVKINVAKPLFLNAKKQKIKTQGLNKKMNQKLKDFKQWILQRRDSTTFELPQSQRQKKYDQFDKFQREAEKVTNFSTDYSQQNIVFITFKLSAAKRQIQQRNILNFWNLCQQSDFPIPGVKVQKAPEPEEIKWQCIGFPHHKKTVLRFDIWIITLVLIGISLAISIGIAFVNKDTMNVGVSIGISIIVTMINVGLQLAIAQLTYLEKEQIASQEQTMVALKIAFAQLANSIGVPILVTVISQSGSTSMKEKSWLKVGGLVDDVFFIALANVVVPLALFLDPWEQWLRLRRWWYSRPLRRLDIHGQEEFNRHFANYNFDIGYEYSYLIKTAVFTSLFACLQPVIALFAPLGLMTYYFATKRNLLYHFRRPHYHFPTINRAVDFLLLLCPLAFGFGNLMVNNFIEREIGFLSNGTLLPNWVIVMVAAGFALLVPLRIFYCCLQKPQPLDKDYTLKQMELRSDYDRLNPETKERSINQFKQYLCQLKSQNRLPDEAEYNMALIELVDTVKKAKKDNDTMLMANVMSASKIASANNIPESSPRYDYGPREMAEYKKIAESYKTENQLNYQQSAEEARKPPNF